jgi:hypothetical protein
MIYPTCDTRPVPIIQYSHIQPYSKFFGDKFRLDKPSSGSNKCPQGFLKTCKMMADIEPKLAVYKTTLQGYARLYKPTEHNFIYIAQ